jgi:pantoate--beta-alanine ligase
LQIIRDVPELRTTVLERRLAGDSVGLLATMGFLHEGQLALARQARDENGCVVVSIFVNPLVFGTPAEAAQFPRDEARDLALLEQAGVDVVFLPAESTLLPADDATRITIPPLAARLEGASRPGHLEGAMTVMLKLLHLVGPARLYLGQKDAQQVVVLRRMLRDLFVNVELVVAPTVRDDDGLALSWLNASLSIEERHAAPCLFAALTAVQRAYDAGERSAEVLRARMGETIAAERRARLDYVSIADAETLVELDRVMRPAFALVTARIGRTRLTDCLPLGQEAAD